MSTSQSPHINARSTRSEALARAVELSSAHARSGQHTVKSDTVVTIAQKFEDYLTGTTDEAPKEDS